MDHPCEKCGAAVEDGRPFCPQCRAPQIHVPIAIPDGEAGAAAADVPVSRISHAGDLDRGLMLAQGQGERGFAGRSALKAGVVGVFLSWVISLLGFVLAGSLAVYFYRRERGFAPTVGVATRLGAAAGIVSFAISFLMLVIRVFAMHGQQAYVETVLKSAQAFGYNTAGPEIQEAVHFLVTPSGMVLMFLVGMICTVALSALGGALAAVVLRRRPSA